MTGIETSMGEEVEATMCVKKTASGQNVVAPSRYEDGFGWPQIHFGLSKYPYDTRS